MNYWNQITSNEIFFARVLTTLVHYTNVWFVIDTSCPPRSTICLEIRFSTCRDKCCINLNIFLKKKKQTTPSYTKLFQDGRPKFDKCIRYFIDLQNCITTEKNFQNVRALDRKILHYNRFEAYGILFYLSHQCISWVRIWIRFGISIFSFIMSTNHDAGNSRTWDESI